MRRNTPANSIFDGPTTTLTFSAVHFGRRDSRVHAVHFGRRDSRVHAVHFGRRDSRVHAVHFGRRNSRVHAVHFGRRDSCVHAKRGKSTSVDRFSIDGAASTAVKGLREMADIYFVYRVKMTRLNKEP